MIEVKQLLKRFKSVTALKSIDLKINEGDFFGLLGPNGAGKSTLMNLLSGYIFPDEGEMFLDGKALKAHDQDARKILGLVPQSLALYQELSAQQNMDIFGKLFGLSKKELKERSERWLNAVQLWDRRNDKVKGFSGGMKRRLNIATSLLHEPKVLLCDEPTVGVDPQSRNAIFEFLEDCNRQGLTIIYTTHYMEEVERMCDRIGIIDHGEIIACGSKRDLLAKLPFEEAISFDRSKLSDGLYRRISQMGELKQEDGGCILMPPPEFKLSELYLAIEEAEVSYQAFDVKRPSLEALFLHLTGRSLRE